MINDLLQFDRPFLLVLDDLQTIQNAFILQVLGIVVDNQPESLRLAVLLRIFPSGDHRDWQAFQGWAESVRSLLVRLNA